MDLSQPPDEPFSELVALASQNTGPAINAEQPHGELKPASGSRDVACAVAVGGDKSRVEGELLPKAPPRAPTHPRPPLRAGRVTYEGDDNDVERWNREQLWLILLRSRPEAGRGIFQRDRSGEHRVPAKCKILGDMRPISLRVFDCSYLLWPVGQKVQSSVPVLLKDVQLDPLTFSSSPLPVPVRVTPVVLSASTRKEKMKGKNSKRVHDRKKRQAAARKAEDGPTIPTPSPRILKKATASSAVNVDFSATEFRASKPRCTGAHRLLQHPLLEHARDTEFLKVHMRFVDWQGEKTHVLVDRMGYIIGVLVVPPLTGEKWKTVHEKAAAKLREARERMTFPTGAYEHCRSFEDDEGFPTHTTGYAFGGGMGSVGNAKSSSARNAKVMEEVRPDPSVHVSLSHSALLSDLLCLPPKQARAPPPAPQPPPSLPRSPFAALTFNLGPFSVSPPHVVPDSGAFLSPSFAVSDGGKPSLTRKSTTLPILRREGRCHPKLRNLGGDGREALIYCYIHIRYTYYLCRCWSGEGRVVEAHLLVLGDDVACCALDSRLVVAKTCRGWVDPGKLDGVSARDTSLCTGEREKEREECN
ncbi:hypothetical protein FB45DRAFT_863420 [Roridomyces roridus]|uniref:Uncharacterized protein n=1 Tax=Roridomyces roridus TaxID=1738132 RepID=A0AAD7C3L8_9AGAR|nr:hypothetical protein FB45DRAFT_863420 [Roridomyces roridus]